MGSICSRTKDESTRISENGAYNNEIGKNNNNAFKVQLVAPTSSMKLEDILISELIHENINDNITAKANIGHVTNNIPVEANVDRIYIQVGGGDHNHKRRATMDSSCSMGRLVRMPLGNEAGWPQWLTSVAGEAIAGWIPRQADSFHRLEKIGQGTYSSVYKAKDLETGKMVAMKKVRFVNKDPESVRFMAREIQILRRLDHPNVMKLEGIVTSRMSDSLYLVFEYMEHDLAGLAATSDIKFTEPQIKCYMKQLLQGLEHCHNRAVLHRDIKGSNLLIDVNGVLKIADFGLATFYDPKQSNVLTSRVVTLWYRAPELLLGATDYGAAIDLWSTGCIIAELFAGKPIMPGRTEVEQMHKIFKLCGSPTEEYWRQRKLPHATSFKPQQPYKRRVVETFKNFSPSALALVNKLLALEPESRGSASSALNSEFFTTEPLPCKLSALPKYPPSKELDAKIREEEKRTQRVEAGKERAAESVRRGSREIVKTPEFITDKAITLTYNYDTHKDGVGAKKMNAISHSTSMIHPYAAGPSLKRNGSFARNNVDLGMQKSCFHQELGDNIASSSLKKDQTVSSKDSSMSYVPRKNRLHYSGPLMPSGGNIEDILKEHERQIQQAVRKACLEKSAPQRERDANSVMEVFLCKHPQTILRGKLDEGECEGSTNGVL